MLMIVVLLVLSWIVLKLGGEKFNVLGLFPSSRRSFEFFVGFLPASLLALIYFGSMIWMLNAKVEVNDSYSLFQFAAGSWWTLRSVLIEELAFRGALLFLAIKYIGKLRGILLSSAVFGIYHWFSYEVIGDITAMVYTFIITGVGGLAFAYAYAETRSLYLPIGLHFGWNLITITVFSQGMLGEQFLISVTENTLGGWWRLLSLLYQICLMPLITYLCLKYLALSRSAGRKAGYQKFSEGL
jgi:membrane protease YdiL (CAAX protease family)